MFWLFREVGYEPLSVELFLLLITIQKGVDVFLAFLENLLPCRTHLFNDRVSRHNPNPPNASHCRIGLRRTQGQISTSLADSPPRLVSVLSHSRSCGSVPELAIPEDPVNLTWVCRGDRMGSMKSMEEIRREAMALSAGERASLAHDLILSLEDPDAYELSPEQEAEIRKRVRKVKSGEAVGRPAAEVLAEIEAKLK
jgi:putative addiction module component (TIGR02574 family)